MSYTVRETLGTAPYQYDVIYTYAHRTWLDGAWSYSGLEKVCYDKPAVPYIAPVAPVVHTDNLYGWNASAYSTDAIAGDCYVQFTVPAGAIGVVCGLAPRRISSDPRDVPHAFYVNQQAGKQVWRVTEHGVQKTEPVIADPETDLFRIERRGETVRYFFNRKTLLVSEAPARGALRVVSCLYAAGDGVN